MDDAVGYLAPIHRPTTISQALLANFRARHETNLILAKANYLEIWQHQPENGFVKVATHVIHGTIFFMEKLKPLELSTDMILVGTRSLHYFTLIWNQEKQQIETFQSIDDPSSLYMRNVESINNSAVHISGRYVALHCWEGTITLCKLMTSKKYKNSLFTLGQARLKERYIKSFTFIPHELEPQLAFLTQPSYAGQQAELVVYNVTYSNGNEISNFDMHDRAYMTVLSDPTTSLLIPVPAETQDAPRNVRISTQTTRKAYLGGVLMVGELKMAYYDATNQEVVEATLPKSSIWKCAVAYDKRTYFVGDDYGNLAVIRLITDGAAVTNLVMKQISTTPTSLPSQLVYLGHETLFVVSSTGDSQFVVFDLEAWTMRILPTSPLLANNGPILDFHLTDLVYRRTSGKENRNQISRTPAMSGLDSGRLQMVAGCGAFGDGSLRCLRSGKGVTIQGILDGFERGQRIFCLSSGEKRGLQDIVAVSFIQETRLYRFDEWGGVEEMISFGGLSKDVSSILIAELPGDCLLQVSSHRVLVSHRPTASVIHHWQPPSPEANILHVAANQRWLVVTLDGQKVVCLALQNGQLVEKTSSNADGAGSRDDITSLCLASHDKNVAVLSYWESKRVDFVELPSLQVLHSLPIKEDADHDASPTTIRDVFFGQIHPPKIHGPTLLVSLENGSIVTYNSSPSSTQRFQFQDSYHSLVGVIPPQFMTGRKRHDGSCEVLALFDYTHIIHSKGGEGEGEGDISLSFSATTLPNAIFSTPFHTEAYPDSHLFLISQQQQQEEEERQLVIAQFDADTKTIVRTFPQRETVRRIAYSPVHHVYLLCCIRKELVGTQEKVTTSLKLVDDVTFRPVGSPLYLSSAQQAEMPESIVRAELPNQDGHLEERFIIGYSSLTESETLPPAAGHHGRADAVMEEEEEEHAGGLQILGLDDQRNLYQLHYAPLNSPCTSVDVLYNKLIVLGGHESIVLCTYKQTDPLRVHLPEWARASIASTPMCIEADSEHHMIAVADMTTSLTVFQVHPEHRQQARSKRLSVYALHQRTLWSTAMCRLRGRRWLEADDFGNLIVLGKKTDSSSSSNTAYPTLTMSCSLNLGQPVNRIRSLPVSPASYPYVTPEAVLGTVDGGVYCYGTVQPAYSKLLIDLQVALSKHVVGSPGNLAFADFRAFADDFEHKRGPVRFVDGEFVERFHALSETLQDVIAEDIRQPRPKILQVLAGAQRMRK